MVEDGKSKLPVGRLERVALRECWPDEALNFTPWLAQDENLKLLGDAIGFELEMVAQEKAVGPFYADILCRNPNVDEFVLIENQLESTDHTHLGQVVTYAAGLQATSIVWIAREFRDEHRAALDWLNAHTVAGVRFFGVTVELWRIGSSPVAPRFNLVSYPNDWSKSVSPPHGLTPGQQARQRYWMQFRTVVEEDPGPLNLPAVSTGNWVGLQVGKAGTRLYASISATKRFIRVELYLSGANSGQWFEQLKQHQGAIEGTTGPLDWQGLIGRVDHRIALTKAGVDPTDESDWPAQHAWLRDNAKRFHAAFAPLVKTLQEAPMSAGPGEAPGDEG